MRLVDGATPQPLQDMSPLDPLEHRRDVETRKKELIYSMNRSESRWGIFRATPPPHSFRCHRCYMSLSDMR
ncbi:hypothetical protein E2C01_031627 [Portunus trituberculatus]|uniref:Uncharacterized protein n=1 Tax=Portunus trituberculatus TaxID=210409 RepID=A0A5B7EV65_PORTR|nr:hypothetical protein [Portunus trituberculatus]